MADKDDSISSSQLMLFIISSGFGLCIINISVSLFVETGQDAWISALFTGMFLIPLSLLVLLLLKRYNNKNIYQINKYLFGKYFGFVLNLTIQLYIFFKVSLIIRVLTMFIRITLLPKTNIYILAFFILLPFVYVTWFGLKPICRFNTIIPVIMVLFTIYIVLIRRELTWSFIIPIGQAGIKHIIKGIIICFNNFWGIILVPVIYPNIIDKENATKYYLIGNIILSAFILLITITLILLFGENLLKNLTIPLLSMTRIYRALILERVDLYFIGLWIIAIGSSLIIYLYCGYYSLNKSLKLNKYKKTLIIYTAVAFLMSRLPKNSNNLYLLFNILDFIGAGIFIFFIICYILSFFIKRGVIQNDK